MSYKKLDIITSAKNETDFIFYVDICKKKRPHYDAGIVVLRKICWYKGLQAPDVSNNNKT